MRSIIAAVILILGSAAGFSIANRELPLIRNSITYQHAAINFQERATSLSEFALNRDLNRTKPILFSLLLVPFDRVFGAPAGIKILSFASMTLFLLISLYLFNIVRGLASMPPGFIATSAVLAFFNPLVIYHFYACNSDTLFSALFAGICVNALVLAVRDAGSRGTAALVLSLVSLILLSIHVRYIGMALVPGAIALVILERRKVSAWFHQKSHPYFAGLVSVSFAAGYLIAAFKGVNPFLSFQVFRLEGGKLVPGNDHELDIIRNAAAVLLLVLLLANVSLLPGLYRARDLLKQRWVSRLVVIPLGYVVFLIFCYSSTWNTARLLVPILPILAVLLAWALHRLAGRMRRAVTVLFLVISSAGIASMNVATLQNSLFARFNYIATERLFDEFRVGQRFKQAQSFELLNRLNDGSRTIFVSTDYYGDEHMELLKRLGYLRDTRNIHFMMYCRDVQNPPSSSTFLFWTTEETVKGCEQHLSMIGRDDAETVVAPSYF